MKHACFRCKLQLFFFFYSIPFFFFFVYFYYKVQNFFPVVFRCFCQQSFARRGNANNNALVTEISMNVRVRGMCAYNDRGSLACKTLKRQENTARIYYIDVIKQCKIKTRFSTTAAIFVTIRLINQYGTGFSCKQLLKTIRKSRKTMASVGTSMYHDRC